MGRGEEIVASFEAHPSEKLIGVFEYMEPGFFWDVHNIVFISQDGEEIYLYHYLNDEDTEELKKLQCAFEFFKAQNIVLEECPVQVIPPPLYSKVLYPPQDLGKPVYINATLHTNKPKPVTFWQKIASFFSEHTPQADTIQLNEELSFSEAMETVTVKRWQSHHIPLYNQEIFSGA